MKGGLSHQSLTEEIGKGYKIIQTNGRNKYHKKEENISEYRLRVSATSHSNKSLSEGREHIYIVSVNCAR